MLLRLSTLVLRHRATNQIRATRQHRSMLLPHFSSPVASSGPQHDLRVRAATSHAARLAAHFVEHAQDALGAQRAWQSHTQTLVRTFQWVDKARRDVEDRVALLKAQG